MFTLLLTFFMRKKAGPGFAPAFDAVRQSGCTVLRWHPVFSVFVMPGKEPPLIERMQAAGWEVRPRTQQDEGEFALHFFNPLQPGPQHDAVL